jgi:hypothetical protein
MVSGIYYSMWAQHTFRSIGYGQIGMAEPSEKASISGANPRCRSRAEQIRADQNNGNKNRKRCNIITLTDHVTSYIPLETFVEHSMEDSWVGEVSFECKVFEDFGILLD